MSTTISFDQLDDATREYLTEVREREGRGSPGVFAPVTGSLAGCGCITGAILVITTLCGTLFSGIIAGNPTGVAMLQTAGLVLGGWMLVAAFRVWGGKNSPKRAGKWVYADPLFLYEANGEEVKVTPVDDVIEAQFTHNYNNGAYQNSVVKLRLAGNAIVSAQMNSEQRAENMVVYYNYLGWARGGDGGDRAGLAPAVLGGLAKYVAKNDNEPLDGEGNVNLDLVELDITEVPEEPRREGGGVPNLLPYVFILVGAVACFFVMKTLNGPFRDDHIHDEVMKEPVEPRALRWYLTDERNTRHRDAVLKRLANFYQTPILHVQNTAKDAALKAGMIEVLEEVKSATQPVVSIRVKESSPPVAGGGGGEDRAKKVRTLIADKISDEFARIAPAVQPPPGMTFNTPPPPIGHQLISFVEAPEDAAAHFEIDYKYEPDAAGALKVKYTVTIRTKIEGGVVASKDYFLSEKYTAANPDPATTAIADQVVRDMVGLGNMPIAAPPPPFGVGD